MNDDHLERRLTRDRRAAARRRRRCRARARRSSRTSRADRRGGRRGRGPRLPRVAVARPPRPGVVPVRRRRAHALALDRACLGAAERPSARRRCRPSSVRLALALLRASSSAAGYRKALDIMALQGVLQRMEHGHRRSVRPRPLLRLGLRHSRRPRVGLAARRAPSLPALHRRREHPRRRAVLPRRVADPRGERVSLGREGLPDDAARGGRGPGDRALARPRAAAGGSCSRRNR